jgi:hypothetical protein
MSQSFETSRVPEFEGPDHLFEAIEALADTENDGAVIRNFLPVDVASELARRASIHGYARDEAFASISAALPTLTEVTAKTEELWDKLALPGMKLRGPFIAAVWGRTDFVPHIDVGLSDNNTAKFYGPVAGSLALFGAAEIGLERIDAQKFIGPDGRFSFGKTRKVKEELDEDASTPEPKPLRSQVEQRANDLVLMVHPIIKHSVKITQEPRVALIIEQSMTLDSKTIDF